MAYEIVLIETSAVSAEESLATLLTPERGFCCARNNWESVSPQQICRSCTDLILAVARPDTPNVTSYFEFLRTHPIVQPSFAVLPESSDDQFIKMASEMSTDFIFSPVRREELFHRLYRILGPDKCELDDVRRRLTKEFGMAQIIGKDPVFLRALEHIPIIGSSSAPVLITGETGTGKEVCARAVHLFSSRSKGPFIPVECGALPENLAESELFGHVRGAFTDAHTDHRGLVALAEGGTLFLDEVDALSLGIQAKLLRFLEDGSYRPVGGERFSHANVRIVTASNRDLDECGRDRTFRTDLYFRLNVLSIRLPALRERHGDVELLARYFVRYLSISNGAQGKSLSSAALRKLDGYAWPGNVRELYNVVQRAVVFSQGLQIQASEIDTPSGQGPLEGTENFRQARRSTVQTFERRYVEDVLRKHKRNITQAAREAGMDRRSLGRLVKKYGLNANSDVVGHF